MAAQQVNPAVRIKEASRLAEGGRLGLGGIQRNARYCQADITIYVTRVEIQLDILHSHLTTRVVSSARREGFRGNLAALCFIWRRDHIAKRTAVYIDGFNLYFGALKDGPYRWLDLKAMCESVLGDEHTVVSIKYFTAYVRAMPNNNDIQSRQKIYLKALEAHTPELSIIRGHFSRQKAWRQPVGGAPEERVQIWRLEEKGSDVNLAVHLLHDAWLKNYDAAVVISNDSDLAESIRLVRNTLELPVGLIPPTFRPGRRVSHELSQAVSFIRPLRESALRENQLPNPIPETKFHCPQSW